MGQPSQLRITFDPARLSPEWPNEAERLEEWRCVVEHYLPRLRDFFTALTGDRDESDEIVSHVLRRALLKLHEIGDSAAAWSWLCRTGRNYFTDLRRRERTQSHLHASYEVSLTATERTYVAADLVERIGETGGDEGKGELDEEDFVSRRIPIDRATYQARLAALSLEDRRLLELIELEGKSHAEAAQILGLSSAAASRKRHSRARHFVREGTRAP